MDVCAERNYKVADLLTYTVIFCTFQVNRNGSCGRLGSKGGGISRNLIFDQGERILLAYGTCDHELDCNTDQMHDDHNEEYFPENA